MKFLFLLIFESGLVISKKKFKIAAAGILVSLSLGVGNCVVPVHAATLDDQLTAVQKQLADSSGVVQGHRKQLDAANKDVSAARAQLEDAKKRLEKANEQLAAAQAKADQAQSEFDKSQEVVAAAEKEVEKARAEVEQQKKLVGEAARSEFRQNSTLSGIAMFFGSEGTADLAKRAQWAKNLAGSTEQKLNAYEASLEQYEAKLAEAEKAKSAAEAAKNEAVESLNATQSIAAEAQAAADEVNSNLAVVQAAYDSAAKLLAESESGNTELKKRADQLSAQIAARDSQLAQNAAAANQAASVAAAQAGGDWVTTNIAPGQKRPLSVQQSLARAQAMNGSPNYEGLCLGMMANLYGYSTSGAYSAQNAANMIQNAGQMQTGGNIPVGALVFYNGWPAGNPYGHVALYAGNGMVWSNGKNGGVGLMSINTPVVAWGQPLIGWSSVWLPNAR